MVAAMRRTLVPLCLAVLAVAAPAAAEEESVDRALCDLIEPAARDHGLPVAFMTRLIWRESSFRTGVTSRAGAQGVAQFMPGTAAERGLLDPFDPEQAIPAAAALIADLRDRFGSLGLAAAAYNGGPTRVAGWLGRVDGVLPLETEDYVAFVTGASVYDWKAKGAAAAPPVDPAAADKPCVDLVAQIRIERPAEAAVEGPFAPWGVQLAGNFSKARALARYERVRARYAAVLGDAQPMIVGTRLRNRGVRRFYRVRAPAATREAAGELCRALKRAGGACVVFRSR